MKQTDLTKFEEKTTKRREIFSGKVIQVAIDDVTLPDGKTATRELVFHPGGVGIMPFTQDNKMIFIKQFRKPLEKVTLEIPAGKIDPSDQDPIDTAKRELEEETQHQAAEFNFICSFFLSPGFANEILYLYSAKGLTAVENPLPQDEDEFVTQCSLTFEEAQKALHDGLICDVKTMYAIQFWELERLRKKNHE